MAKDESAEIGWVAMIDPKSKKTFYYNKSSGKSQWQMPEEWIKSKSASEDATDDVGVWGVRRERAVSQ